MAKVIIPEISTVTTKMHLTRLSLIEVRTHSAIQLSAKNQLETWTNEIIQ